MPAVTAAEFALHNLRFQQQPVKLLQKLFILERVALGFRLRNRRKAELSQGLVDRIKLSRARKEGPPTSLAITCRASQSIRGRILRMKSGWKSHSCSSSSASRK